MNLTKDGALQLAAVIATCMTKRKEVLTEEQKDFLQRVGEGKIFTVNDFSDVFPLEESTRDKIVEFSRAVNSSEVDSEIVVNFFGGGNHAAYSIKDIEDNGLGKLWKIFLLFHMLLPVRIIGSDSRGYVVKYENFGREVTFFGIVSDQSLTEGAIILIHYGIMVGNIDGDPASRLLKLQGNISRLEEACEYTGNIDCDVLRRLS